jgi:electron transport complex protein RnfC
MNLIPTTLDSLVNRRQYDDFAANNGMDCIECGCCTVVCPAKRHLTQSCREGKRSVMANRKKAN